VRARERRERASERERARERERERARARERQRDREKFIDVPCGTPSGHKVSTTPYREIPPVGARGPAYDSEVLYPHSPFVHVARLAGTRGGSDMRLFVPITYPLLRDGALGGTCLRLWRRFRDPKPIS